MISLLLFITALVICIIVVVLLILDAMKTQKYFEIQQQFDKYNLHLTETNDGKIVEKTNNNNNNTNGNNSSNNSKKVNMDDYVLKSKLKPSIKCPDMTDYIKKTQIPSCKTCPDMDNYVKKTDICHLVQNPLICLTIFIKTI
jgi:autotransporter adhesin